MKLGMETWTRRRRFLEMTALGGVTFLCRPVEGFAASANGWRTDVRQPMLPSFQPNLLNSTWTPEASLEAMASYGCEVTILSFVLPLEYIYEGSEKPHALEHNFFHSMASETHLRIEKSR